MTRTSYTLDDIGGRLPWRALYNFVRHVGMDSALSREINPDDQMRAWLDGSIVAPLLADLFDLVNARTSGKHKPKPYPRPWTHRKEVRKIGRDPIRAADFAGWWNSKGGE